MTIERLNYNVFEDLGRIREFLSTSNEFLAADLDFAIEVLKTHGVAPESPSIRGEDILREQGNRHGLCPYVCERSATEPHEHVIVDGANAHGNVESLSVAIKLLRMELIRVEDIGKVGSVIFEQLFPQEYAEMNPPEPGSVSGERNAPIPKYDDMEPVPMYTPAGEGGERPANLIVKCPKCGYGASEEESLPIYPPGLAAPDMAVICPHCKYEVKVEIGEGIRDFAKLADFIEFFAAPSQSAQGPRPHEHEIENDGAGSVYCKTCGFWLIDNKWVASQGPESDMKARLEREKNNPQSVYAGRWPQDAFVKDARCPECRGRVIFNTIRNGAFALMICKGECKKTFECNVTGDFAKFFGNGAEEAPECHVCSGQTQRTFQCLDCGSTTLPTRAAQGQMPDATQLKIDISNLQFYARMADEHDWEAEGIHKGVIIQTLNEIAERLRGGSPARSAPNCATHNRPVCEMCNWPAAYVPARSGEAQLQQIDDMLMVVADAHLQGSKGYIPPDGFFNRLAVGLNFLKKQLAALGSLPSPAPQPDDYVAWLHFVRHGSLTIIRVCDSDSKGAFKVYRARPSISGSANEAGLNEGELPKPHPSLPSEETRPEEKK